MRNVDGPLGGFTKKCPGPTQAKETKNSKEAASTLVLLRGSP